MPDEEHYAHDQVSKSVRGVVAIAAGTLALILAIVMLASFAVNSYFARSMKNEPSMSEAAIAQRLKPIGQVAIDPTSPATLPAAPAAPADPATTAAAGGDTANPAASSGTTNPAAGGDTTNPNASTSTPPPGAAPVQGGTQVAAVGADKGKATYDQACTICHGAGIAGAPKTGDKVAWAPRIALGLDTLYASALKGKNAMPAKGGNAAVPDDDVKAAVDYLVGQSK